MLYVLLLFAPLLWMSTVQPAMARCPDVNTAVNCSFTSGDECLTAYNKHDKHGLKWLTKNGAIYYMENSSYPQQQGYNRQRSQRYRLTKKRSLDARPDSGDYAVMIASNDSRAWGLWTELVSPPFTADNHGCLYFHFHNNVCKDNPHETAFKVTLRLDSNYRISNLNMDEDVVLREYSCINGSGWYRARLPVVGVSGTYRAVFSAQQQREDHQLVAVDDVVYADQSCSIQDDAGFVEGDCDWEDTDMCRYRTGQDAGSQLRWRAIQKEMFNEAIQQRAPSGYFLAVWGKDDRQRDEMNSLFVESPMVTIQNDACLSVMYFSSRFHLDNNNITALIVSVLNQSHTTLKELPATLGKEPIRAFIPLPQGEYSVRFTAQLSLPFGEDLDDVILLDDVEIHDKSCDEIRCDDALCEDTHVEHCGGRGECLGSGLKHKSCQCSSSYIGTNCEYDPSPPTPAPSRRQSHQQRSQQHYYHG